MDFSTVGFTVQNCRYHRGGCMCVGMSVCVSDGALGKVEGKFCIISASNAFKSYCFYGTFIKCHYMGGNLTMRFSCRSIRFMSLNSVDGQSLCSYLSLTHFPAFAKNRRDTADVQWSVLCCPAVCREQADMARKAQAFPGSIFPSANSVTE